MEIIIICLKSPGNHSDQGDKLTEKRKVHGKLGNSQTLEIKRTSQFEDSDFTFNSLCAN